MEGLSEIFGDTNIGGYAMAFVAGFFIGKKVASMGFIFMIAIAVGGYLLYQSTAGGAPAE